MFPKRYARLRLAISFSEELAEPDLSFQKPDSVIRKSKSDNQASYTTHHTTSLRPVAGIPNEISDSHKDGEHENGRSGEYTYIALISVYWGQVFGAYACLFSVLRGPRKTKLQPRWGYTHLGLIADHRPVSGFGLDRIMNRYLS